MMLRATQLPEGDDQLIYDPVSHFNSIGVGEAVVKKQAKMVVYSRLAWK